MKIISIAFVALAFLCSCCKTEKSDPVNVATFNIRLAPNPEFDAWKNRRDAVCALIKKHGFEIFGTQEGYFYQLEEIVNSTGYKFVAHGREDGKRGGETAAVFYNPARFELLDSGAFWFAETPDKPVLGWDAACKRVCSWGEFRDTKTDKIFYFFCMHLDHMGKVARAQSAKMLAAKVAEIAKGKPFFCVGDFNATTDQEPMKIIFSEKIFQDSLAKAAKKQNAESGTFHAYTGQPKVSRIDYILVSDGVDVSEYSVIKDSCADLGLPPASDKIPYPSDHFPVKITAEIKK